MKETTTKQFNKLEGVQQMSNGSNDKHYFHSSASLPGALYAHCRDFSQQLPTPTLLSVEGGEKNDQAT
jgi:hypothetical protein